MPADALSIVVRLTAAALQYGERIAFRAVVLPLLDGTFILATFDRRTVALTLADAEQAALAAEGDGAWQDIPDAERDPDSLPLDSLLGMIRASAVADWDVLSRVAVAAGRALVIPGALVGADDWAHPCWPDLRALLVDAVTVETPSGYTYATPGTPVADKPIASVSACDEGGVDIWHTVAGKAAVVRIMALRGYAPCYEHAPASRADGLIMTAWRWIG